MARTATNGKDVSTADLQDQIATLKGDISMLADTIKEMGASQKSQVKVAAADKAEELRKKGKETLADAQKTAGEAAAKTEDSIRENPTAAVGIAAGLGFLVGLVAGRR